MICNNCYTPGCDSIQCQGWFRTLWRNWRQKPGLTIAAQLAETTAYSHPNTKLLGPENNLLKLSTALKELANR